VFTIPMCRSDGGALNLHDGHGSEWPLAGGHYPRSRPSYRKTGQHAWRHPSYSGARASYNPDTLWPLEDDAGLDAGSRFGGTSERGRRRLSPMTPTAYQHPSKPRFRSFSTAPLGGSQLAGSSATTGLGGTGQRPARMPSPENLGLLRAPEAAPRFPPAVAKAPLHTAEPSVKFTAGGRLVIREESDAAPRRALLPANAGGVKQWHSKVDPHADMVGYSGGGRPARGPSYPIH
jgi:hypothetical protein